MISKFIDILQEENLYTIHNLRITSTYDGYKHVKRTFQRLFVLTTVVKKITSVSISIPLHYFEFGSTETLTQKIDQRIDDTTVLTSTTLIFFQINN